MDGHGFDIASACKRLATQFGYTYLDAADLLRAEVARGVGLGLTMEKMISDGMIVPVELTLEVISNAMRGSGNDKFILTGFPRAVDEVQAHHLPATAALQQRLRKDLKSAEELHQVERPRSLQLRHP